MGVAMAAIRRGEKRRTQQFLSRTSSQLDISSQSSYRSARCNYYKYKKVQAELLRLATFVVTNNAAVLRCIGRSPANQIIYRLTSAAKTFRCTIGPMLAKVVTKTLFFANSLSHLPLRNTFYIALERNIRDMRNISSFLAGEANKHEWRGENADWKLARLHRLLDPTRSSVLALFFKTISLTCCISDTAQR